MVLHLDQQFKPISGKEISFEHFTFSGGEPHIKIHPDFDVSEKVNVTQRINSFNDLGLLCMAVDALQRMGATLGNLFIPYFPAARQDRVMIKGEPLSIKIYTDMINRFPFEKVFIFDPHSEVMPALLDRCTVLNNHTFIKEVIKTIGKDVLLVSPDGGALKKIYKLSADLDGIQVIECSKSRDVKTGQLTGFKAYTDDLHGQDCLIVDDICDGGGTFIGLAKELKSKNAGDLYLAVSHGIFSKGLDELSLYFGQVFTTDSVKTLEHEGLITVKLERII